MRQLKCVNEINGFTVNKGYKVIEEGVNLVRVLDDNLIRRTFKKVKGNSDFKNWFTGIASDISGREISNLIAKWADENNLDSRDLPEMSVAELMNILMKDK